MDSGDIIEERKVDNPTTSWAQFLHELDTKPAHAGKISATVNLTTLLGGFAKFGGTEAQQKAAARFKAIHERAQVGGSRAVDPSNEPVDGGWLNPEAVFESGHDARKEVARSRSILGRHDYKLAEFVILGESGPSAYTKWRAGRETINGRMRSHYRSELYRIMDRLAVFWGYQTR